MIEPEEVEEILEPVESYWALIRRLFKRIQIEAPEQEFIRMLAEVFAEQYADLDECDRSEEIPFHQRKEVGGYAEVRCSGL